MLTINNGCNRSSNKIVMDEKNIPEIILEKSKIPVVYLDTCIMLDLLKHKDGIYKNEYTKEIGELYDLLLELMCQKRILCPLGNQMVEMGVSTKRVKERDFLYSFTNAYFQNPYILEQSQLDQGFQAFINEEEIISFDFTLVLEKDVNINSQFKVNVATIYKKDKIDKLKQVKQDTVAMLNEVKEQNRVAANLEDQLERELKADFEVFVYILEHANDSVEAFSLFLDSIIKILRRNNCEANVYNPECVYAVDRHNHFLLSNYHHKLPYVWIQSVLWAHRMQRSNKIKRGDNLDTVWAASYLPFVDYAVTDNEFCTLLQGTGLAQQYGVQVYSMRTINDFIRELKSFT